MKKQILILTLLLALLLCACTPGTTESQPPESTPTANTTLPTQTTLPVQTTLPTQTTLPPETSLPTEPTVPETTVPETSAPAAVEAFAEWYQILEYTYPERNWVRTAMNCVFETPEDIALDYLFYNGLGLGSWDLLSPESEQYLIDQGFWREMDIQPMPAEELNKVLLDVFGMTLEDATIPESWVYLEREDFYCSNNNDAVGYVDYTITDVTAHEGGLVEISYTVDSYFYDTQTDEYLDFADLVLTLRQTKDGSWQVVSNILVPRNDG